MASRRISSFMKRKMEKSITSGDFNEIYQSIEKLPISGQEKMVLSALIQRELAEGFIGNTAKEILKEVEEASSQRNRKTKMGFRIWSNLKRLEDRLLIQSIEGRPKLYVLNREMNPINIMMYPYYQLEATYDMLPDLERTDSRFLIRVRPDRIKSYSTGVYSTNDRFIQVLIELISISKKEILSSSLIAQSFEQFPRYAYALISALERGVCIYCLLSGETPVQRLEGFKQLGVKMKVVKADILRRYGIPNVEIIDQKHLLQVNRYAHTNKERIRYGYWHKYNKLICKDYVSAFWQVWKNND